MRWWCFGVLLWLASLSFPGDLALNLYARVVGFIVFWVVIFGVCII